MNRRLNMIRLKDFLETDHPGIAGDRLPPGILFGAEGSLAERMSRDDFAALAGRFIGHAKSDARAMGRALAQSELPRRRALRRCRAVVAWAAWVEWATDSSGTAKKGP